MESRPNPEHAMYMLDVTLDPCQGGVNVASHLASGTIALSLRATQLLLQAIGTVFPALFSSISFGPQVEKGWSSVLGLDC